MRSLQSRKAGAKGQGIEETRNVGEDPRSVTACRVAVNVAGADLLRQSTRWTVRRPRFRRKQHRAPSVCGAGPVELVSKRHPVYLRSAC